VEEFNANYRAENAPLRIEAPGTARMYCQENRRQNYGYKFLEAVYELLQINSFIKRYEKVHRFRGKYAPVLFLNSWCWPGFSARIRSVPPVR